MQYSDPHQDATGHAPRAAKSFVPAVIGVGVLGLIALVTIPAFVTLGKPGGIKYSLVFAVLFLTISFFGFQTRVRKGTSINGVNIGSIEGARATTVSYSKTIFCCLLILLASLSTLALFATIDFYQSIGSGTAVAAEAGAVIAAVAAIFFLLFPAQVIIGGIRLGKISLTEAGIHHRGWAFKSFLPWTAFAGIQSAYHSTPEILVIAYQNTQWRPQKTAVLWTIEKPPPVPMIDVNCAYFDIDPDVMFNLLKFYLENPDARGELGTDASSRRIADQRLL